MKELAKDIGYRALGIGILGVCAIAGYSIIAKDWLVGEVKRAWRDPDHREKP